MQYSMPSPQLPTPVTFRKFQGCRAFSLVEVVMALGIVSFAFMGILGMIPIGLSTTRQAIDFTVQSQISQKINAAALQTSFADLDNVAGEMEFDEEGNLLTSSGGTSSTKIYKVQVDVDRSTVLYEGGANSYNAAKLATVRIYILNTRMPGVDTEPDLRKNRDARVVTTLVPDTGA